MLYLQTRAIQTGSPEVELAGRGKRAVPGWPSVILSGC
nr:hypothetical protein [Azospirillum formosense]